MQGANGELPGVQQVSLVMRAWCTAWTMAKRLIYRGFGVSWVVGTHLGVVLVALGVCSFIPGLWSVFQRGAEQQVRSSSLMTWQSPWVFQGMDQGAAGRAGGDMVVQKGVEVIVGGCGAGGDVPLSVQCIQTNASARPRIMAFAGLWMVSVHRLQPGNRSLGW